MPNQITTQPMPAGHRRRMDRLGAVLGALVLGGAAAISLGGAAAISLGGAAAVSLGARAYDVSVTEPHSQAVERALRGGMELSVRSQTRDVTTVVASSASERARPARVAAQCE